MLVPFNIDPVDPTDLGLRTGRERMAAITQLLDNDENWTPRENRALHLREDQETEQEIKRRRGWEKSKDAKIRERVRRERATRLRSAYEEFVYFEPYVQNFLYGRASNRKNKQKDPIALFSRNDITGLSVDYRREYTPNGGGRRVEVVRRYTFNIERCNLYLFETGNAMLALEVKFESVAPVEPSGYAVLGDDAATQMTLADCQVVMENLRRVFPPYFSEAVSEDLDASEETEISSPALKANDFSERFSWHYGEEDQPPTSTGSVEPEKQIEQVFGPADAERAESDRPFAPPMFEPWREILKPLYVEGGPLPPQPLSVKLGQTGDDRAFVMAQIGVPDSHQISRSDWVRLCYCDAPGRGYPYAEAFLSDFEQANCYDRFFDNSGTIGCQNSRVMICNYAFVMVGSCQPVPRDFFGHVLSRHFRRHYFQLVMICFLHREALLSLSERLAAALDHGDFTGEAESVKDEILRFTHRYWFEEISSQIQGHELFAMLRLHLRTRQIYQQLNQEVSEATAMQIGGRQDRLNRIAGIGLALSVIVGMFGMNFFGTDSIPTWAILTFPVVTIALFCIFYLFDLRDIRFHLFDRLQPKLKKWWR